MTVDDAEAEEGRTLFVANLPPDATEENLRALFGTVGPIEEIKFGAGVKEVKVEEAEETDSEGFGAHRTQAVDHRLTALPRMHV